MKRNDIGSYEELVTKIRDEVRKTARELPGNYTKSNGSIRVSLTPHAASADEWIGGLSTFTCMSKVGPCCVKIKEADIATYEFAFAMNTSGNYSAIFEYPLMLSHTAAVMVRYVDDDEMDDFVLIHVSVSGADNVEYDRKCTDAALDVIDEFFGDGYEVVSII